MCVEMRMKMVEGSRVVFSCGAVHSASATLGMTKVCGAGLGWCAWQRVAVAGFATTSSHHSDITTHQLCASVTMVLLAEDPAQLISSAYNAYSIGTDTDQLNTIQANLARIEKLRQQKLLESEKAIRDLQFALKHVKEEADTNVGLHARKDHGNKMYTLDKEKFALAKAINERESKTHELENEKARLEERLAELEEDDRRGEVYGNIDDTVQVVRSDIGWRAKLMSVG